MIELLLMLVFWSLGVISGWFAVCFMIVRQRRRAAKLEKSKREANAVECTIFNEHPKEVWFGGWCYYSSPPPGSRLTGEHYGNRFAIATDGFEWVMYADARVRAPTGCLLNMPSIESQRSVTMISGG